MIWQAGNDYTEGRIVDTYLQNGANAVANANMHNAASKNALLIELGDGSKVLKLENEVKRG
ncbi:MAG: hypothetical protein ACXWDO_09160 [Bacteroidia bacterium]